MNTNKNKKILLTGGHSTPAFAVLDELKNRGLNNFIWVSEKYNQRGTKNPSNEYKTVTEKYKIKFINIKAGKIVRKWTRQTFLKGILEFINLFIGFIQGFFIILKNRPNLVMSFGGFLAVPIVFWGKVFRAKVVIHEQTIVAGLANKLSSKFADKVLLSFESSKKFYPENKIIFTGNPIRKDIFEVKSDSLTKDFDNSLPTIYLTAGNQGSNIINTKFFEILPEVLKFTNVIHQTGNSTITNDNLKALEIKNNLSKELKNRYTVREYVGMDEIGEAFGKCFLIIGRGGANTSIEILALGKLAIMIPIPWASYNEQRKNADLVASTGLALVLDQNKDLTSKNLLSSIETALSNFKINKGFNGKDIEECRDNAKTLITFDSSVRVCNVIESLL